MTTHDDVEDRVFADWTTEELMDHGLDLTRQARELDDEAKRVRMERCAVLDELNRHRDPRAKDDEYGGRRIATCAAYWDGMRFQSLRASLQRYWDERGITYSPDDRPELSNEDIETIRERFRNGESKRQIAGDYGIARATVKTLVLDIEEALAEVVERARITGEEAVTNLHSRLGASQ